MGEDQKHAASLPLPSYSIVVRVWRTVLAIYMLHPIGRGAFTIVIYEYVLVSIAKGDVSMAVAIWGTAQILGLVCRLLLSSTIGALVDRYGRRRTLQLNFAAAVTNVLLLYCFPSV